MIGKTHTEAALKSLEYPCIPGPGRIGPVMEHHHFLACLKKAIKARKWKPGTAEIALTTDERDMILCVEVSSHSIPLKKGISLWIGGLNCNSKMRKSRIMCGVAFMGRAIPFAEQLLIHIPSEEMDVTLAEAVDEMCSFAECLPSAINVMKRAELPRKDERDLMIEALQQGLLRLAEMSVLELAREECPDMTAWGAMRRFTIAACSGKGGAITHNPVMDQLTASFKYRNMLMERCECSISPNSALT